MQALKLFSKTNVLSRSVSSPVLRCCITTSTQATKSFKIQDEKDFNERVKKSKTPVIVDFFATWCNPCKALTPRIESVVAEKEGKVVLAKVDIDEHANLADDYDNKDTQPFSNKTLLILMQGKELTGSQEIMVLGGLHRAWCAIVLYFLDDPHRLILTWNKLQIKTVPVLLVMRNGKVEDRIVGLQDTDKLHKFIDKVISTK